MHIDARTLENGSVIEGDICIIGAGAAGISMALEWIDTPFKVILLEGGGFEVDMRMQDLYRGRNIGQHYYPLQSSRLHYFGGTTGHWAGFCSVLDPIDFKKRAWVDHSGWPIQHSDLEPYYKKARRILELESDHFDLDYWMNSDRDLIPLPFNEEVISNKMWQFSPPTRFGKKYRDTIINAKNIHLYTHANVVNIEANENVSLIKQVQITNFEGKAHTVCARHFVMACCSIQNARLLLASNKQATNGLGNDKDLVGRYFMEHIEVISANLLMPTVRKMKLYRTWVYAETKVRAELAISDKKQEEYGILNGTASLTPAEKTKERPINIDSFTADAASTVNMWERMEEELRENHPMWNREHFDFSEFELFTRMEQAPNPQSRVILSDEKDELGVPRANLDWRLSAIDKRSIRKFYELLGQEAGKAGIGRVHMMEWLEEKDDSIWPSLLGGGWHHMGTTRMSASPDEGVVDPNCKVHGIDNLFIAGSSCFTTSGNANPTLPLIALTLRLSDHLKEIISQHPSYNLDLPL